MENSSTASRPITAAEASVVESCLHVSERSTDALLASVGSLRIIGNCGCGCGSVSFAVDPTIAEEAVLLVEATGKAPNGDDLMIAIWAQGGSICEMEVFCCTGGHAPLPVVSSIMPWTGAGASAV